MEGVRGGAAAAVGLDAASFDPEAVTGWALVRAHHLVARRYTATLAEVGLTPSQFGVLLELARVPGESQAALARSALMTPQAMGEMLAAMATTGLVSRTPGGPGAPTSTALTDAGWVALRRALPVVAETNGPRALGLDAEEDSQLNALLHKVLDALRG